MTDKFPPKLETTNMSEWEGKLEVILLLPDFGGWGL